MINEFVYFTFLLSGLFILLTLPFIILVLILYSLSSKFKFRFKLAGFYKISEIAFEIENALLKIRSQVESAEVGIKGLRIRIYVNGVKTLLEMKKSENLIEGLKLNSHKREEKDLNNEFLIEKEKFFQIIKNKFLNIIQGEIATKENKKINTHTHFTSHFHSLRDEKGLPFSGLDNLANGGKCSKLENLIKFLLKFLDVEISNVDCIFKMKDKEKLYHGLSIKNIIIGVVKGIEKVI